MANLHEAKLASERAWDKVQSESSVRPSIVGIVAKGSGFGLTITLPKIPKMSPPDVLFGVPVEYHYANEAPSLMGAGPKWRRSLYK